MRWEEKLKDNGIFYKIKTDTRLSGGRGRMGINQIASDSFYHYRIFVKKEDFDRAKLI